MRLTREDALSRAHKAAGVIDSIADELLAVQTETEERVTERCCELVREWGLAANVEAAKLKGLPNMEGLHSEGESFFNIANLIRDVLLDAVRGKDYWKPPGERPDGGEVEL
jgi:hypothetical protein